MEENTGRWMIRHGIDKWLLKVEAKKQLDRMKATGPTCWNCDHPIGGEVEKCPACDADMVPF